MNTIATFENTVSVLVKAYLEGALEATDCAACACGNLVAAANGYKVVPFAKFSSILDWVSPQGTSINAEWQDVNWGKHSTKHHTEEGYRQISSTGYTIEQFRLIEDTFMDAFARPINGPEVPKEEENFRRLMAVVDVLAQIHGIDLTTATAAKALFVKAA